MQLVLKSTGADTCLDAWIKGFKDIDSSLLLEIDLTDRKFVAKGFPDTKDVVKYAELTFAEAGYELAELNNNEGESALTKAGQLIQKYRHEFTADNRIKVGVYHIIGKFIDVLGLYSGAEHSITISFDSSRNVKYVQDPNTREQWQAERLTLTSKTLTMNVNCSQLSEFFYFLPDNTYCNVVCNLDTPVTFTTSTATLANLHKISSLFNIDKQVDTIRFYIKQVAGGIALYAYDNRNHSYDYQVGYIADPEAAVSMETEVVVGRDNFIKATRALTGEINLTLSQVNKSRMLVTSGSTKIIVASMEGE